MYNYVLKGLIESFRHQDVAAFEVIFEEFKKNIYYYARRQKNEDLIGELTLFLIELIYRIDIERFRDDKSDDMRKYISVSLKNKYISICRKQTAENTLFSDIYKEDLISGSNLEDSLDIWDALKCCTPRQREIIICKYIYCLSDFEISEIFKISRQAVNRLKNRGLKELKEYYSM